MAFIHKAQYTRWLSNIILVVKRNCKIRVCIDFKKLNLVTLKDEYPILMVDILIDAVIKNLILSLMDGHLDYNQIFIKDKNIRKTAFKFLRALGSYG